MKEEDHLESPLLADEEPADRAKGCTYALLASIPTIIYGYNRGVMSGAQKFVQSDLGVTDAQLEVLIGATSVYSLVGSPAAGWACDRAGRRRTIVLSAALFLAGSAVTAAANGYAALMAGQLVAGVACGFGLVVAPVYIAEISPANGRGFLSSFPEIASNLGILLSYIADFALAGLPTPLNWRLMIGIGMAVNRVMSAVVAMTFISMYEAVGMARTFHIFAAVSVAAWVFVYACLPETKGRSLEEMEALFDGGARAGAAPSTRAALS